MAQNLYPGQIIEVPREVLKTRQGLLDYLQTHYPNTRYRWCNPHWVERWAQVFKHPPPKVPK